MLWCHAAGTACLSLGRLVSTGSHGCGGASMDKEHSGSLSMWGSWPALQRGGIGIDTLCLNVLKFNCNCNLILLVWWSVSIRSYRILLWSCRLKALLGAHGADGFALLSGARGWPGAMPTACLNCPAKLTLSCSILGK